LLKWQQLHTNIMAPFTEGRKSRKHLRHSTSMDSNGSFDLVHSIRDKTLWLMFARWSVVMHYGLISLTALYMDFAVLKIRDSPTEWHIIKQVCTVIAPCTVCISRMKPCDRSAKLEHIHCSTAHPPLHQDQWNYSNPPQGAAAQY
jgi:hypothetical protein